MVVETAPSTNNNIQLASIGEGLDSSSGKLVGIDCKNEKEVFNNNWPGKGPAEGGGYSRGRGGSSNRGRRYDQNWKTGWRQQADYNNSFHQQRVLNEDPSSAYRGNEQTYFKSQDSAPVVHFNSQAQGYFDPQMTQNYCHIYPQSLVPDSQGGFYIPQEDQHGKYSYSNEPGNGVESLEQGTDQVKPNEKQQQPTDDGAEETLYPNKEEYKIDQENITYFSTNPLFSLGMSVEQDKQIVLSFSGMKMMPSTPFPPNYSLQYFYVPYGTPPPQHIIPVMVTPFENPNGNEFPPPIALHPSYVTNQELLAPSPVEIYQPTVYTWPDWPHQMMAPIAQGITDVTPEAHSSLDETQIKEANYNNNYDQY